MNENYLDNLCFSTFVIPWRYVPTKNIYIAGMFSGRLLADVVGKFLPTKMKKLTFLCVISRYIQPQNVSPVEQTSRHGWDSNLVL